MHVCPRSRARNLGRAGAPTSKPSTRFTSTKRVRREIVEHHASRAPRFDTCGRAGGLGPGGERQNGAGITPVVGVPVRGWCFCVRWSGRRLSLRPPGRRHSPAGPPGVHSRRALDLRQASVKTLEGFPQLAGALGTDQGRVPHQEGHLVRGPRFGVSVLACRRKPREGGVPCASFLYCSRRSPPSR
jgi:hypothetical protein